MTAPEWAPGHIVGGKYTVRAELGRGARMRTYAALTEPNREVVLRAVGPENAAELDGVAQRLSALAALPEAYVLRVVDVARDVASGARFVVTDRSRSPSLKSLVELCPLTLDEGLAFASKLGAALDAMHERRVLHLALRPANVFVGAMPEGGVEIADAGVPRLDESHAERVRWTAPEAHDGPKSVAADVFTAALVIFFAVTGKSYFAAEGEQELAAEIAGPRVAASKRASELGVTLPASIDAAFDRALAADPRARPRSVGELARMLGSSAEDKEKPARPPELVKPPADLVASLIDSELGHADISVSAAAPPTSDSAAAAAFPPPPEPAAPLPVLAPPLLGIPPPLVAPALAAPPLDEALPPAKPKRRVGLVLGAVGGAVVLLVVVTAVALGTKKTSVVGSPTASATASTAAAATGSAGAVASVATAPSASSSAAPLDPEHSELLVVCEPACDLVMVDRKRMASYPEPVRLAPGQHGVGVSAHDYWGDWKLVETKGGERATVTFKLRAKADLPNVVHAAPATSASAKKPCGKFLKRCDD